jgi:hypothetical protein
MTSALVYVALAVMSIVDLIVFGVHRAGPPTISDYIAKGVFLIVMWPVALVSRFAPIDSGLVAVILCMVTCFFWAAVIEGTLYLRSRRTEKKQQGLS